MDARSEPDLLGATASASWPAQRVSLESPVWGRALGGFVGGAGASEPRLGSCSRPQMAPQVLEKAQNAPGMEGLASADAPQAPQRQPALLAPLSAPAP